MIRGMIKQAVEGYRAGVRKAKDDAWLRRMPRELLLRNVTQYAETGGNPLYPIDPEASLAWHLKERGELEKRGIVISSRPISTGVWETGDGRFGVTARCKWGPDHAGYPRDYLFDTFEAAALFLLSQPA